ncbi:MAG: hypothetical protein Q9178_004887 [Gyalolechia marmorata]
MAKLQYSPQIWLEADERSQRNGNDAPIAVLQPEGKITSYDDGKIVDFNDGGKHVATIPTTVATTTDQLEIGNSSPVAHILGLRRKSFIRLLLVLLVIVLGVAVGGGVGGTQKARQRKEASTVIEPAPSIHFLAAPLASKYYQQCSQPATPLAAAAGYPHANYNNPPVKNVYYMATTDELFEHQAPSNDSQAWKEDNFSGLYRGSNSTLLAAYWNQDFYRESQQLVVLFQEEDFANGITQGRYTSNSRTSNPWVADNFGFSQPQGSAFALCPVTYRNGKQITHTKIGIPSASGIMQP